MIGCPRSARTNRWCSSELKGQPEEVRVHDFEIRKPEKGKVAPYGVYDLGRNVGWVRGGVDTARGPLGVDSIGRWGRSMGSRSSASETPVDYRRFRRQQWGTGEAVEVLH